MTVILKAINAGDANAAHELLPLVYSELRKLAAWKMARASPNQTLQPTALVHEAWLKLTANEKDWQGLPHFFNAAAEAMRQILVDQARRKATAKHGAGHALVELEESQIQFQAPSDHLLAVHEALDHLAAEDGLSAQVVKLRYFVGLSIPEIAEALEISPRSADRHWSFARAWLKNALDENSLA